MSIIGSNILAGASGQAGYNLNNSLRYRNSNSAYLSRTNTTNTSLNTWTWSAWVKRGTITSSALQMLSAWTSSSTNNQGFGFATNDTFCIYNNATTASPSAASTAVFRDPAAWYHVVVKSDGSTTVGYINGTQVVSYSGTIASFQLASNISVISGQWSRTGSSNSLYFDGYMTEINFVDGQALTPSSFGETDTTTGSWKPKSYSGTYGTNGFELNFSDIATTSGSNAGLGKDFSGNANYFNTNNISVTAGITYDAMLDVPTNTSATVGNYCTWNPNAGSFNTLSNGNLTYSGSTGGDYQRNGTLPVSSGKWYYETVITTFTGANADMYIGFSETSNILNNTRSAGIQANQYSIYNYASATYLSKVTNGSGTTTTMTIAGVNDVLMFALDLDNNKIWFGKNGTWIDSGNPATGTTATFSSVTAGSYVPAVTLSGAGVSVTLNSTFGQRPFTYTPPTGFNAWNTYNLPTPTILQGNKYMDATLYTGNNTTNVITNAGTFKPDFLWIKTRSAGSYNHHLMNSIAGATKALISNGSGAEITDTSVTSFNSNGFSLAADTTYLETNQNGSTYVGWQWQAGQGSSSSNTSGSITSTVSVNTTAGFSIVQFTATGATATVGHGLGVAPKMIIVKDAASAGNWAVWHTSLTSTAYYLFMNTTAAQANSSAIWTGTPSSTTFGIGSWHTADRQIAYCWAEITGYSKFGSYTGNGSADGPFVYLGFRPKFILFKVSSTTNGWVIYDTVRDTYNYMGSQLYPNLSNAEAVSSSYAIDATSNGFKVRTSNGVVNDSGQTFIYMAFAENPFKNANAR